LRLVLAAALFWWIVVEPDVDPELRVHSSQIYKKSKKQRKLSRLPSISTTTLLVDSSTPKI